MILESYLNENVDYSYKKITNEINLISEGVSDFIKTNVDKFIQFIKKIKSSISKAISNIIKFIKKILPIRKISDFTSYMFTKLNVHDLDLTDMNNTIEKINSNRIKNISIFNKNKKFTSIILKNINLYIISNGCDLLYLSQEGFVNTILKGEIPANLLLNDIEKYNKYIEENTQIYDDYTIMSYILSEKIEKDKNINIAVLKKIMENIQYDKILNNNDYDKFEDIVGTASQYDIIKSNINKQFKSDFNVDDCRKKLLSILDNTKKRTESINEDKLQQIIKKKRFMDNNTNNEKIINDMMKIVKSYLLNINNTIKLTFDLTKIIQYIEKIKKVIFIY